MEETTLTHLVFANRHARVLNLPRILLNVHVCICAYETNTEFILPFFLDWRVLPSLPLSICPG